MKPLLAFLFLKWSFILAVMASSPGPKTSIPVPAGELAKHSAKLVGAFVDESQARAMELERDRRIQELQNLYNPKIISLRESARQKATDAKNVETELRKASRAGASCLLDLETGHWFQPDKQTGKPDMAKECVYEETKK